MNANPVYVLLASEGETRVICGVFSSRELAQSKIGFLALKGIVLRQPSILDFFLDSELAGGKQ